jgi:MCP family monocarboxylic acid transporter-like MFS transporter 10
VAGVVYPTMTRYLIDTLGFVNAVRCVAGLVTITSIFSLVFSTPNPDHVHPKDHDYRKLKTWIDTDAFRNKAFCWFMASVSFLFLGFYPVFFNLEEVSNSTLARCLHMLTIDSGHPYPASECAMV